MDDPATTVAPRAIIPSKPHLRRIYEEWYEDLAAAVPVGHGAVVELGSGPGFMKERIPEVVTSEVLDVRGSNRVLDGRPLAFRAGSLRAVVMTDVLHHIGDPRRFFLEATRTVRPGGAIVMIEPG